MPDRDSVTLPDGSEVDSGIFDNLESSLLDEDQEEFRENRFNRRKADDPTTPFTSNPSTTVRNVASVRHQERSERAQATDEAFNAPAAPSYEAWRKNPQKYDIPGVDTVPEDEIDRRGREFVNRAQEAGAVDTVERETIPRTGTRGEFSASEDTGAPERRFESSVTAEPDLDEEFAAFREGSVLAHESGHALDFAAEGDDNEQFASTSFFDGRDDPKYQQALDLTRRVRGEIPEDRKNYREDPRELVADAVASRALEPRAASREAPDLVGALEDELDDIF